MSYELSVVIPTFNEKDNIVPLFKKLSQCLIDIKWEVIFVDDDSPDKTSDRVRDLSKEHSNVRCIQRIGRRGLSSACIEGMLASSAEHLAVMDADMQHDETLLPKMLETLKSADLDMAIGSRYVDGGDFGNWTKLRLLCSKFATFVSKKLLRVEIKDSMSGFFMLKKDFFHNTVRNLTGQGFKILLDLCISSPEPVKFKELPYTFGQRESGESKLGTMVIWEYGLQIADKLIGRFIPVRFVFFVAVGCIGALAHVLLLGIAIKGMALSFVISQIIATIVAMTINFNLDNVFTYHDKQLKGSQFFKGLFSFYLACGLGAIINVYVANSLFKTGVSWWGSGLLGAIVGSVWNYAITANFTWSSK